jgi:pyruvate,water dikinase
LDLAECSRVSLDEIGGKARGLGRLLEQSLEVPPGFVVTTGAYREWMRANGFDGQIERLLARADGVTALQDVADDALRLLEGAELESSEIDVAYRRLPGGPSVPVAIRSSAIDEDAAGASFAGAQDTHLSITGHREVRRHIVRCWASLFTPAAISYRRRLGLDHRGHAMAVVVQRMVAAEAAGVMFSLDPLSGDPSQITVESTFGLGGALVSGDVTPDRFSVDKVTLEIRSRVISVKPFADRIVDGEVSRVELDSRRAEMSSLADDEVLALARVAKAAERQMDRAIDMEWALGPGPSGRRHLYLLQARPETVWSNTPRSTDPPETPRASTSSAMSRIAFGMRQNTNRHPETET